MHELAVAQGLVAEAARIAAANGATAVDHIVVRIGPLSGVEASLLERAFAIARTGGAARAATLAIEPAAVEVVCSSCGEKTVAVPPRIVCGDCGDWKVRVVAGEDLILVRLELSGVGEAAETGGGSTRAAPGRCAEDVG